MQNNTHVLVVKLNQNNVTVKFLQDTIGKGIFKVRQFSDDKNVFHMTSDISTTYKKRLQQVQKILQNQLKPPLMIEYIRSTAACPSIEKYNIPSTDLPFNTSLANYIDRYCVGDFYTGAYWNETQLQELDLAQKQELLRQQRLMSTSYSAIDNLDVIQEFSENLESVTYLKQKDLKKVANNFNTILADEKTLGQDKKRNSSNKLLARLKTLLVNTSLDTDEEQTVGNNFAVRVENIKKTGNAGVLVYDNGNSSSIFQNMETLSSN